MRAFRNILILHPGAIGDVVMGTPVAHTLKQNFPDATVTYFTHASLFPLLELCNAIDRRVEWRRKDSVLQQLNQIRDVNPDLIVDLTNSLRTKILRLLAPGTAVAYRKQRRAARPVRHVVDLYMQSLTGLSLANQREPLFPSLSPNGELTRSVLSKLPAAWNRGIIAIVPGVGKHRPNRAWPKDHWIELGKHLLATRDENLVIIGGADDTERCEYVRSRLDSARVVDFAGKLSLPETAALLSECKLVVSADTGPQHISVAVGTPVVSVMGPTMPERSGPYGMKQLGTNVCDLCKCQNEKTCLLTDGTDGGDCMKKIDTETVLKLVNNLAVQSAPPADATKA